MRSSTSPDFEHRCRKCFLQIDFCLCDEVVPITSRTRLVIVRHALETPKSTNTARIALLALPNAELWEYGSPDRRFDEAVVRRPGTWLLFPGTETQPEAPASELRQLVVLDGTWPQARRMAQRIEALRGLPRLSLPARPRPSLQLRRAPSPEARSTIEAIADALSLLEGGETGEPLRDLHRLMVRRVLEVRAAGGDRVNARRRAILQQRPP